MFPQSFSRLYPIFQQPDIIIDGTALDLWKHNQLMNTDALLTVAITMASQNPAIMYLPVELLSEHTCNSGTQRSPMPPRFCLFCSPAR